MAVMNAMEVLFPPRRLVVLLVLSAIATAINAL